MVASSDALDLGLVLLDRRTEVRILLVIHVRHSVGTWVTPIVRAVVRHLLGLLIAIRSKPSGLGRHHLGLLKSGQRQMLSALVV